MFLDFSKDDGKLDSYIRWRTIGKQLAWQKGVPALDFLLAQYLIFFLQKKPFNGESGQIGEWKQTQSLILYLMERSYSFF